MRTIVGRSVSPASCQSQKPHLLASEWQYSVNIFLTELQIEAVFPGSSPGGDSPLFFGLLHFSIASTNETVL